MVRCHSEKLGQMVHFRLPLEPTIADKLQTSTYTLLQGIDLNTLTPYKTVTVILSSDMVVMHEFDTPKEEMNFAGLSHITKLSHYVNKDRKFTSAKLGYDFYLASNPKARSVSTVVNGKAVLIVDTDTYGKRPDII